MGTSGSISSRELTDAEMPAAMIARLLPASLLDAQTDAVAESVGGF